MGAALDWFQCKSCGRRQKWRVDLAGQSVTCRCGAEVVCPPGPTISIPTDGIGGADTIIESADAPSAASPILTDEDLASIALGPDAPVFAVSPASRAIARQATKRFIVWTVMMLLGLSMLIHAIITQFWWYIALAVLIAPLSFWKFLGAKRAWQRGRSFWTAVAESVGTDE